ncbi:hypothetical protein HY407_04935 [Candidatus Gottesmanbacteria bacterium]|nr:hypothetical protein [Candidatus Gottesmanbacteria bacterium]
MSVEIKATSGQNSPVSCGQKGELFFALDSKVIENMGVGDVFVRNCPSGEIVRVAPIEVKGEILLSYRCNGCNMRINNPQLPNI